jgi:5'-methylthioadenosine phosphorylase
MAFDFGLIGGSGMAKFLAELGGTPVHIPTERGCVRGRALNYGGHGFLVVTRHAAGHRLPPHRVPYLAIAQAMRSMGVAGCLATAAVGSLRPEWPVGSLAVATDFLDPSARNVTVFDQTVVHTPFSTPFPLASALVQAAQDVGERVIPESVYVNVNGPRYETPAEIRSSQTLGGDVVGMTCGSEAIAMGEFGVPYGCLCIVTNLAAGLSNVAPNHPEVEAAVNAAGPKVVKILLAAGLLIKELAES